MNNVNMRKILSMVLFTYLIFGHALIHSMEVSELTSGVDALSLTDGYDSDSEDEAGYKYKGYGQLELPSDMKSRYLMFYHGEHFSPSYIAKEQRSYKRRNSEAGQPIYSAAAYEVASKNGEIDCQVLEEKACKIKAEVSGLEKDERNKFQQLYTNSCKEFYGKLGRRKDFRKNNKFYFLKSFSSAKDPLVPTSEGTMHAACYAYGSKEFLFTEGVMKKLSPEYDAVGKPRHPYLGKIYMALIPESEIKDLDPYFVVDAHANNKVAIGARIIHEQEVDFPGYIPGKYIVGSVPVRVPSFNGEYKSYFEEKYELKEFARQSNERYSAYDVLGEEILSDREKATSVLVGKVSKHAAKTLKDHVLAECGKKNITIVYKSLDDGFCEELPSIEDAKNRRKSK